MQSGFNCRPPQFLPADARRAADRGHGEVYFNSGVPEARQRRRGARQDAPTARTRRSRPDISADGPIGQESRRRCIPTCCSARCCAARSSTCHNVGAQPEPPVTFNNNVQALVGVLNVTVGAESLLSANLNTFVGPEVADPPRRRRRWTSYSSTTSSRSTRIAGQATSWLSAAAATT